MFKRLKDLKEGDVVELLNESRVVLFSNSRGYCYLKMGEINLNWKIEGGKFLHSDSDRFVNHLSSKELKVSQNLLGNKE